MRYAVYVAGALLVFFVAVGMGAAAALLVGWQPERAQAGYGGAAGSETREETAPAEAKTGADAFEGTAIEPDDGEEGTNIDREEPTEEPPPEDTAKGASFVHRATDGNSRGDYTYLDDPLTNGEPGAVVLVTQNWNPGGGRLQRPPRGPPLRRGRAEVGHRKPRRRADARRGRLQRGRFGQRRKRGVGTPPTVAW